MASARTRRRVTLGVLATAAILSAFAMTGGITSGLRSVGAAVVEPFSWAINVVTRPIGHFLTGALNYADVLRQNEQLRHELGQVHQQNLSSEAVARQLQELTAATNVPFVGSMARVIAPVSSNSPTNFAATIDIAKGRRDGVLAGMAVVANGGLVGRVISTTAHGATVRLITDQRSVIGVAFGDGSTNALLYGRGATRPLALSDIPQSAVVTKGTVLATNSLEGSAFPPGLPVATVQQATLSPGSANYNLVLAPAADLAHLSYVDVVLWEPGS